MAAPEKKPKKAPQNREFIRLDVLLPVSFTLVNDPAQRLRLTLPNLGFSINLSSGGMLLATDRELPEGTRLQVSFSLFHGEPEVWCDAKVLFTERQQEGAVRRYLSHLTFVSPDRDFQDKVMRFVFDRQRRLKRHLAAQTGAKD
jgi:c-di-GMP-binding flagellar brake protein YcgR